MDNVDKCQNPCGALGFGHFGRWKTSGWRGDLSWITRRAGVFWEIKTPKSASGARCPAEGRKSLCNFFPKSLRILGCGFGYPLYPHPRFPPIVDRKCPILLAFWDCSQNIHKVIPKSDGENPGGILTAEGRIFAAQDTKPQITLYHKYSRKSMIFR